jgi:hypothetical protein
VTVFPEVSPPAHILRRPEFHEQSAKENCTASGYCGVLNIAFLNIWAEVSQSPTASRERSPASQNPTSEKEKGFGTYCIISKSYRVDLGYFFDYN